MIEIGGVKYYLPDEPTFGDYKRMMEFKHGEVGRQKIEERLFKLTYLIPYIYRGQFTRTDVLKNLQTPEDEGKFYTLAVDIINGRIDEVAKIIETYTPYIKTSEEGGLGVNPEKQDEVQKYFKVRESLRKLTNNYVIEGEKIGYQELLDLKIIDYLELLDATDSKDKVLIIDRSEDDAFTEELLGNLSFATLNKV